MVEGGWGRGLVRDIEESISCRGRVRNREKERLGVVVRKRNRILEKKLGEGRK
jgi:hypothetical protein